MDRTTIAAGVASMEDKAYFEECCHKIITTREWTKAELRKLGFSFQDSRSNFIFATHESCPAKEHFAALREKHIYVRYFPKDRIDNHLRITIGTDEEMDQWKVWLKYFVTMGGGEWNEFWGDVILDENSREFMMDIIDFLLFLHKRMLIHRMLKFMIFEYFLQI